MVEFYQEEVSDLHNYNKTNNVKPKNRVIAGLLALCFGFIGIHNFYLGRNKEGYIQLGLSVAGMLLSCLLLPILGIFVSYVWSFVEAIMIFTNKIKDGNGLELVD